jgi:hypothetical protein
MTGQDASSLAGSAAGDSSGRTRLVLAFVSGALIGVLGGMIGLGGAEFRLPLLIGIFGFAALQDLYSAKLLVRLLDQAGERFSNAEDAVRRAAQLRSKAGRIRGSGHRRHVLLGSHRAGRITTALVRRPLHPPDAAGPDVRVGAFRGCSAYGRKQSVWAGRGRTRQSPCRRTRQGL